MMCEVLPRTARLHSATPNWWRPSEHPALCRSGNHSPGRRGNWRRCDAFRYSAWGEWTGTEREQNRLHVPGRDGLPVEVRKAREIKEQKRRRSGLLLQSYCTMAWWMKDVVQIRALDTASIRSDFSPTKKVLPWPSVLVSGGNALGSGATLHCTSQTTATIPRCYMRFESRASIFSIQFSTLDNAYFDASW
jgi:hypothetical protein